MVAVVAMKRATSSLPRLIGGLLLVGLLAGCGFHLRTWELESNIQTAKIMANLRNPVAEPLGRALKGAGVELIESGPADVTVELVSDRESRRSVSVTDQARAADYETTLSVVFALADGDGNVLSEPRSIRASRIYQVDRNNLVGSSEEQALLQREMVDDLVQQIIRAVNAAVSTETGTGSAGGAGAT